MAMRTFKIEQSKAEIITPHGGLTLVGQSLNQLTSLSKTSRSIVKHHAIPNIDLIAHAPAESPPLPPPDPLLSAVRSAAAPAIEPDWWCLAV